MQLQAIDFPLEGLLQYNYLPNQKNDGEELPPVLSTVLLTKNIASELRKQHTRCNGYDQLEFKLTRYNNVCRVLSIPHPLPYTKLSYSISENWEHFNYISENPSSVILPKQHDDGRIIIMDYESSLEKNEKHINFSFNKKFIVKTDISNFFPSIYTHSIPWALVGFDYAKRNRSSKLWFNKIDLYQQHQKRCETNGVPIGPATSNIIAESILARIDYKLIEYGYEFTRYIDDYTAYFEKYEDAEKFIRQLSEYLSQYKLLINIKKTSISKLPLPISESWIVDLSTRMPKEENLNVTNVLRFMDYAVEKQANSPDGSVIKYAAKSIIENVEDEAAIMLLDYLLNLSINYAIVLPLLDKLLNILPIEISNNYSDKLINILKVHILNKRSDAIAWCLYYLYKVSSSIPREIAESIINTNDCISILMLHLFNEHDDLIINFCNHLDNEDLYQIDQYWMLVYEFFYDDLIANPYNNQNAYQDLHKKNKQTSIEAMRNEIMIFEILKSNNVSFLERNNNIQF